MKKVYIAPGMNVFELEVEPIFLVVSAEDSLPGSSWGGESEDGREADANEHRGVWGDLWE